MVLPPNRVGGTRGPNGTTLDALLLALQGIGTQLQGVNTRLQDLLDRPQVAPADLSGLLDVLGTRADCITGESIVGLLCRLNDSVAGTPAMGGAPPATCPGFPANPTAWYRFWDWRKDENVFTGWNGDWLADASTDNNPSNLYIDILQPYGDDPAYTLQVVRTTTNGTNVCISWEGLTAAYGVMVNYWNYDTDSLDGIETLDSDPVPAAVGSRPFSLDANIGIFIRAHSPVGPINDTPTVKVWIVQGPFG